MEQIFKKVEPLYKRGGVCKRLNNRFWKPVLENRAVFLNGAVTVSGAWYDVVKDNNDAGIIGTDINICKGVRSVGSKKDMAAVRIVCN